VDKIEQENFKNELAQSVLKIEGIKKILDRRVAWEISFKKRYIKIKKASRWARFFCLCS